ncbi:MAG: hypothetical protein ACLFXM_15275 [Acidimicrobiia bacterium]
MADDPERAERLADRVVIAVALHDIGGDSVHLSSWDHIAEPGTVCLRIADDTSAVQLVGSRVELLRAVTRAAVLLDPDGGGGR